VGVRPAHRDPVLVTLVLLGGMVGTTGRAWLEDSHPVPTGEWPWATFGINLAGAFLLGLLLESLALGGQDQGWRRRVRLGVGTGALGGFTTYSTFAVETSRLLASAPLTGLGYGLATVALGLALAWAGTRISAAVHRRTREGRA